MRLDSDDIRVLSWGVLGLTVSLSSINGFSALSVLATLATLLFLGYWLFAHPQDLRIRYEIVKARFHRFTGIREKYAFLFWVNLTFLLVVGCFFIAFALMIDGSAEPHTFLFGFIRGTFGVEAYIITVTLFGIYVIALTIEPILGSWVKAPK